MKPFFTQALVGIFLCCSSFGSQAQNLDQFFAAAQLNKPTSVRLPPVSDRGLGLRLIGEREDNWSNGWIGYDSTVYIYNNNRRTEYRTRVFDGLLWVLTNRTLFQYDLNGNESAYVEQDWDGAAWINKTQQLFTLDAAQQLLTTMHQEWNTDIDAWENFFRNTYEYDANGNQTEAIDQQWIGGAWENTYRTSTTYTPDNKPELITHYYGSVSDWIKTTRTAYEYDSNGNVLVETNQIWNVSAWENSARTTYQYDGNEDAILVLNQNWNSGAWENSRRSTREFNVGHRATVVVDQLWDGLAWNNYTRIVNQYGLANDWVNFLQQQWENGTWVNSLNVIIDEAAFDPDYAPGMSLFNNYVVQDWDSIAWVDINRSFFYYETFVGLQELARSFDCRISPNPSTGGMVRLEVSDEGVQPEHFTLYNLQGRRLAGRTLGGASSEQIDLGQLSTGQYFLEVQARGGKKAVLPLQIR